ncbi:hypothetical protein LXL04_020593 [Taraxacum kok-saghyz]
MEDKDLPFMEILHPVRINGLRRIYEKILEFLAGSKKRVNYTSSNCIITSWSFNNPNIEEARTVSVFGEKFMQNTLDTSIATRKNFCRHAKQLFEDHNCHHCDDNNSMEDSYFNNAAPSLHEGWKAIKEDLLLRKQNNGAWGDSRMKSSNQESIGNILETHLTIDHLSPFFFFFTRSIPKQRKTLASFSDLHAPPANRPPTHPASFGEAHSGDFLPAAHSRRVTVK